MGFAVKRLAALALAGPLAACAGAGQEPVARQTADANPLGALALPLFAEIDGMPRTKVGTMALQEAEGGGKIFVHMPGTIGRCSGAYRETATQARVVFRVSCADGRAAEGAFERTGPHSGFGKLRDDRGRHVAFSFGES